MLKSLSLILFFSSLVYSENSRFKITDHALFTNSNTLQHEDYFRADVSNYQFLVQANNRWNFSKTGQGPDLSLEKAQIAAEWEHWNLSAGDSTLQVGKGLALSLYREDVLGINNTLQGGLVKFKSSYFDGKVYGGRVNALLYPVALYPPDYPLKDRQILMAGTELVGKNTQSFQVGANYLYASDTSTIYNTQNKTWHRGGVFINKQNLIKDVDVYAESVTTLPTEFVVGIPLPSNPSFASYGGVVYSPEDWKFQVEVKDFRNDTFEFRKPPTLEEDFIESQNTVDVTAAKLLVERSFDDNAAKVQVAYLGGQDRVYNGALHHVMAGVKLKDVVTKEAELKGGYRLQNDQPYLWHVQAKTKIKTFKGQNLELGMRKYDTIATKQNKNMFDVTYTFSEKFNVSFGYEYVPTNTNTSQHLFNVGAALTWGVLTAKTLIGQTSGGVLCSGGVCRQVPPFSGGMIETTVAF